MQRKVCSGPDVDWNRTRAGKALLTIAANTKRVASIMEAALFLFATSDGGFRFQRPHCRWQCFSLSN